MASVMLRHPSSPNTLEFFPETGAGNVIFQDGWKEYIVGPISLDWLKSRGWEVVKPKQMVNK